ncbi:MAG: hypothetical protein FJZ60_03385 [Chlamydiae bacterium]|nr:hypothetical protein [Chlamydiota bacterium]
MSIELQPYAHKVLCNPSDFTYSQKETIRKSFIVATTLLCVASTAASTLAATGLALTAVSVIPLTIGSIFFGLGAVLLLSPSAAKWTQAKDHPDFVKTFESHFLELLQNEGLVKLEQTYPGFISIISKNEKNFLFLQNFLMEELEKHQAFADPNGFSRFAQKHGPLSCLFLEQQTKDRLEPLFGVLSYHSTSMENALLGWEKNLLSIERRLNIHETGRELIQLAQEIATLEKRILELSVQVKDKDRLLIDVPSTLNLQIPFMPTSEQTQRLEWISEEIGRIGSVRIETIHQIQAIELLECERNQILHGEFITDQERELKILKEQSLLIAPNTQKGVKQDQLIQEIFACKKKISDFKEQEKKLLLDQANVRPLYQWAIGSQTDAYHGVVQNLEHQKYCNLWHRMHPVQPSAPPFDDEEYELKD